MPLEPSAWSWIVAAMLGLGLAAATGLRTFLPLLMAAGAARLGWFGVELNGALAWLASDQALLALGVAAALESLGDKVPVIDHALDGLGTLARPAAGALVASSMFAGVDPVVAGVAGLIIGAPTALAVHGAKAGTRAVTNVSTAGFGAPVVSTAEDGVAFGAVLLTLAAPLLGAALVLLLLFAAFALIRRRRRARVVGRGGPPPRAALR